MIPKAIPKDGLTLFLIRVSTIRNFSRLKRNIVSTVNLNCPLKLKEIALSARNAEYNPRRFAAVVMRLREPKTTALVFASGKMVCTGAKTEEASRTAARKYARIIQKLGNPVSFQNFAIQNIVGSVDVKFAIDLEQISNEHNQFCTYEPEIFPGLVYRMLDPKIVILIYILLAQNANPETSI